MISGIIKKLHFWLSFNHIKRINTYGLFTHLQYVFNFNISRIVVNLQADLSDLPPLVFPHGYFIREMDVKSSEEIAAWIMMVNNSYPDADENEQSFRKHLYDHQFLHLKKIFFIIRARHPVGTVSVGLYRKNPEYGGDSRIAILPAEQGNGLVFFAINYAFHYLKDQRSQKG